MMKKTLLAMSLLGLSGSALAIEGGTPLNWAEHDDMVKINCTGTVIAGKWILTAAHCQSNTSGRVDLEDGSVQYAEKIPHPDYMAGGVDIALWELPTPANITTITFLSMRNVEAEEDIKISGFGAGTGEQLKGLEYAIQISTPQFEGLGARRLTLKADEQGTSVPGDSGAPYTDINNLIIGIHNTGGIDLETGIQARGTRLHFARDFILEHIDGWHYPTLANTATAGGNVTVEVQSLHQASFIDNATWSGDVTVTGGTCLGATVEPFDTCTYEIESSNGYEGKVTLDDGQVITINKGRSEPITPPDNGGGGDSDSSGGSLGFLSLLGLFGLTRLRKVKH